MSSMSDLQNDDREFFAGNALEDAKPANPDAKEIVVAGQFA